MTLKKPSDLFTRSNSLITEDFSPLSLEVGKSDDMSVGLTETFDRFKNNLEKIDELTEQVQSLSEEINSKLTKKDLENAMISHLMVVNENFKLIQGQVKGLNKTDISKFNKGLNEVVHIVDNLVSVEIPKYNKKLAGSEFAIENKFASFKGDISDKIDQYHNIIDEFKKTIDESYELRNQIQDELSSVKDIKETVEKYTYRIDEFQHTNNSQLRKVENFILKNHNHIVELKKEVFGEISKLSLEDISGNIDRIEKKIKHIENVYNSINAENLIGESLLAEPSQTDNGDPLTPLDRKFITQKDLQSHYRLFINRVQQQLASIGGGGETQLKYLDDIVGIATNASAYDGKVLSYNHSLKKFEFITYESGNAVITISDTIPLDPAHGDLWYDSTIGRTFIYYVDDDGPQWVDAAPSGGLTYPVFWSQTNVGIHTLSNVGIGTTQSTSKLTVDGSAYITGISTFNTDLVVDGGVTVSGISSFNDSVNCRNLIIGDNTKGLVLTSPNGTKFKLIVDNSGQLSTVAF